MDSWPPRRFRSERDAIKSRRVNIAKNVFCKNGIYSWLHGTYTHSVFRKQYRHNGNQYLVKFYLCLTNYALCHEGAWGSGCIDPRFIDLGTSRRWVVSFTPLPLYPRGNSPWYLLDRRLGGLQRRSGQYEELKILDPTGNRTPISLSSSQ
jgi:hypothetical protein